MELGSLPAGAYEIYVTARVGDNIVSFLSKHTLRVSASRTDYRKPLVSVIGSCVTRDNFNSRIVPAWREDFDLHGSHYQMALVSLMSPALDVDMEDYADLDPHSRESTRRDFTKEYLGELQAGKPDFLLLDARADVRFGVISVGDSFITDNAWKIGASKAYSSFSSAPRFNMQNDPAGYLELYTKACVALREFLDVHSPDTKVLVVAAREANRFRGLSATGSFRGGQPSQLDAGWEELDKIATEVLNAEMLADFPGEVFGANEHPWGRGPVHYEQNYYSSFRSQLLKAADYRPQYEVFPTRGASSGNGTF